MFCEIEGYAGAGPQSYEPLALLQYANVFHSTWVDAGRPKSKCDRRCPRRCWWLLHQNRGFVSFAPMTVVCKHNMPAHVGSSRDITSDQRPLPSISGCPIHVEGRDSQPGPSRELTSDEYGVGD
jgi:hypothetical protein